MAVFRTARYAICKSARRRPIALRKEFIAHAFDRFDSVYVPFFKVFFWACHPHFWLEVQRLKYLARQGRTEVDL